MRPISLTLQAFGSYPGTHTVDFEELGKRGLFLITGPTGSGKTTIFDAMAWALYGELPGMRKGEGVARSHHVADETTDTLVEFTFETGGKRYRVNRTAHKERAKKRGAGTMVEKGKAVLVLLGPVGDESIALGNENTTEACERIIGLKANQFQRVVLLPQGKFNEFLVGNKESREQLLKTLFGGQLYEDAVEFIKQQKIRLESAVGTIETTIAHHRTNAITHLGTVTRHWEPTDAEDNPAALPNNPDDTWLNDCVARFQPVCIAQRQAVEALEAAATSAEQRAITAKTEADRFDAAAELHQAIAKLEAERPAREADAATVAASQRARPVYTAKGQCDIAQSNLEQANDTLAQVMTEVAAGFTALQKPLPARLSAMTVSNRLQALSTEVSGQLQKIQAAEDTEVTARTAEVTHGTALEHEASCRTAHVAAQTRRDKLAADIVALHPLANQVEALQGKVDAAKLRAEQRDQLEAAKGQLPGAIAAEVRAKDAAVAAGQRFVDTQALRLAKNLQTQAPCPVCGSKEHPTPAHTPDNEAFEFADLKAAQDAHHAAAMVLSGIEATLAQLVTLLGPDALRTVEEVRQNHTQLQGKLAQATEAHKARTGLQGELPRSEKSLTEAAAALQRAEVATGSAQTAAELARARAKTLAAEVTNDDAAALRTQQATLTDLGDIGHRLGSAENRASSAHGALTNAESGLANAFKASGFATIAEALAAALQLANETDRANRHQAWAGALRDANMQLAILNDQGITPLRPDAEGLAEAARAARETALQSREAFTTASNALSAADTAMAEAKNIGAASVTTRAALTTARTVFDTCSGKAGIKVTLERWVLSGELQRVSAAANVHLARMSNERYRLQREEATSSLDLEVFDSHTGKTRSPASLSGGEQFQASLSLALGLADVISQGGTGSGQQFDALFVDEGFGSLDAQALDDAIGALQMIQSGGRMVGAITHVDAMKERLPVGILVEPSSDGRGSRLRMNGE